MSRTASLTPEQQRIRYGWVSTARAAELIGGDPPITTANVIDLIKSGQLRARNIGTDPVKRPNYRIDPVSIEKFLDERTIGAV